MTMRKQPKANADTTTTDAQASANETASVRLDKWLWSMRVYKTRSDASEACRGSAIRLNGTVAKPSSKVRIGDTVVARTKALTRTLYVVGLTEKRVGASLLPDYFEDRTPELEFEIAREKRQNAKNSNHDGVGRPSKKDRRAIEKLNAMDLDL